MNIIRLKSTVTNTERSLFLLLTDPLTRVETLELTKTEKAAIRKHALPSTIADLRARGLRV